MERVRIRREEQEVARFLYHRELERIENDYQAELDRIREERREAERHLREEEERRQRARREEQIRGRGQRPTEDAIYAEIRENVPSVRDYG